MTRHEDIEHHDSHTRQDNLLQLLTRPALLSSLLEEPEPDPPISHRESTGEDLLFSGESGERAAGGEPLDVDTIGGQTASGLPLGVVFTQELGEPVLVGNVDLLASRKFELGATQSLNSVVHLVILAAHRDQDLSDVHTGSLTVRLTERSTHTSLETICTSATQHLVDTKHVERMRANADMEGLLTTVRDHVFVHSHTGGLQSLHTKLLLLIGHHVDRGWVDVARGLLGTRIEDTDFGIRDTTAEPTLRVRLVLAVSVALIRTATHLECFSFLSKKRK